MEIKATVGICPVCGIFYIEENPRFLCEHLSSNRNFNGISHISLTEEGKRGIRVLTQMRNIPPKLYFAEGAFRKSDDGGGE